MNIDTLIRNVNPVPLDAAPGPESFEARAIFQRLGSRAPDQVRRPFFVGTPSLLAPLLCWWPYAGDRRRAGRHGTSRRGAPPGIANSAAVTLAHLADAAASQPAVDAPGPGQYQYTESEQAYESCYGDGPAYCYLLPEQHQIWIGADGSGRLIETLGVTTFPTSTDRAAWIRAGSPPPPTAPSDTTFGPGPHSLSDGPPNLASLPTDPSALGAELSAGKIEGGPAGPAENFVQIGDLLGETDASPALRSALFQVAENIPGGTLLRTVTDHSGRPGIGIARVNDVAVEQEYIFDPTTSALLGEDQIAMRANAGGAGITAGTVLGWAVYLSSGIVDSLSSTPTGSAPVAPPVS